MIQAFANKFLYNWLGWKKDIQVAIPKKAIICLAPHTSNWDFIIGQLYAASEGKRINFLMKKEWFVGPLGWLFKKVGGIPVWRNKHTSMTDNLAQYANTTSHFLLCITPEGTRKANPDWKKGFYYIALKANLPILLYGLDYEKKLIQCTTIFTPSGDIERDMREIKLYFKNYKGKNPHQFTIGKID